MLWFTFSLLLSAVAAAPVAQNCTDQSIFVDNQWTLPLTTVTSYGYCDYKFSFPQNKYALVDIEVQGAQMTDIFINDGMSDNLHVVGMGYPSSVSRIIAVPTNFTLSLEAPSPIQLQIKVSLQNPSPKLVGKITTDLNAASSVLYFKRWQEGTSYEITSKSGKVEMRIAMNDAMDKIDLENVFIYDGGELIGTLYTVEESLNYVSKTNKVTLYMAKQVHGDGVILITDSENVEQFYLYRVIYDQDPGKEEGAGVNGDTDKPGAITLIGNSDGTTRYTLLEFISYDNLNGQFSYSSGGPVVDKSKMLQIGNNNLPKKLTGNVNTIYLSKGKGFVDYSI